MKLTAIEITTEQLTPRVHMNGTGGNDLQHQWDHFHEQLEALAVPEFNARDYYPFDDGDKRLEACRDLRRLISELRNISEEVLVAVYDQNQERR